MNSDDIEMIKLSIVFNGFFDTNLFVYCSNNPVDDRDVLGYISANKIANMFSIVEIFNLFIPILYSSLARGLAEISAYVTKLAAPIVLKAFWWKPLVAGAIIVAVGAIIVAGVGIYYSNRQKEIQKAKNEINNNIMKNGKVDLSKFNIKLPKGNGWKGPKKWRIVKDNARHAGKKWKLFDGDKQVASLLEDGTIYGK